ncbi:MAG TPA: hypothetical protein ENI23_13390 [bacterium]|nr:hypothetical protein [bacterium]
MSRENIRLSSPNFTFDESYFYTLIQSAQVLQVKSDDGTIAFSYPTDTTIASAVNALEYDGVFFYSLEDKSGGNGLVIRKWAIDSFIFKQITSYTYSDGGAHTYSSNDFAIEHYRTTIGDNDNGGGGQTVGMTDINVSDTSMLDPGDMLYFVRSRTPSHSRYGTSLVETGIVQTVLNPTKVRLTAAMSGDPWGDGKGFRGPSDKTANYTPDLIFVTKNIWLLNDNAPSDISTAALYKINPVTGSNIVQYSGTQYLSIKGATFYTKYNVSGTYPLQYNTTIVSDSDEGGEQRYLLFVNGSSLLFFNVTTLVIDRSLAINNVKIDLVNLWTVSDLVIAGLEPNITLFRLQDGTTYGNPGSDESWSEYNYEKTLLRAFVNSIAIVAEPTIIPADGSSTSVITAIVSDQYLARAAGKTVSWTDDSGFSRVSPTSSVTDSFGRASTVYTAGSSEDSVKVTASVVNGLV